MGYTQTHDSFPYLKIFLVVCKNARVKIAPEIKIKVVIEFFIK